MIDLNMSELAWAAGFYDGEGSSDLCNVNSKRYFEFIKDNPPEIKRMVLT